MEKAKNRRGRIKARRPLPTYNQNFREAADAEVLATEASVIGPYARARKKRNAAKKLDERD